MSPVVYGQHLMPLPQGRLERMLHIGRHFGSEDRVREIIKPSHSRRSSMANTADANAPTLAVRIVYSYSYV